MIWHALERRLFPREKGRTVLHGHSSSLPSPPLSQECPWSRSTPALLVLLPWGHVLHLLRTSSAHQAAHPRSNANVYLLGETNSWNQNCIKIHLAEYLQRNLVNFFPKEYQINHTWCLIQPNKHRTIRQLCRCSKD